MRFQAWTNVKTPFKKISSYRITTPMFLFIQNTFKSGNPEQNKRVEKKKKKITSSSNWLVLFLHGPPLSLCTDSEIQKTSD